MAAGTTSPKTAARILAITGVTIGSLPRGSGAIANFAKWQKIVDAVDLDGVPFAAIAERFGYRDAMRGTRGGW